MTYDELLDSVPMGGTLTVYAPLAEVAKAASERNSRLNGEWYDIAGYADRHGRELTMISRREVWNIASKEHVMQALNFYKRCNPGW